MNPIKFNLFDPAFHADPYPVYTRLRDEEPVHRTVMGAWVITRYADIKVLLRDNTFGVFDIPTRIERKSQFLERNKTGELRTLAQAMRRWLMLCDPPDHTRLRGLVNRSFTPSAVESLRPRVQEMVDRLIARVRSTGKMEIVGELACPLAVTMIASMLGVPEEAHGSVTRWADGLSRVLDPLRSLEQYAEMNRVAQEFLEYFRQLFAERRRNPQDDLISSLIAVTDQGDKLTEDEMLSVCMLLFIAGEKTTVNLISNGVLALLRNRDEFERLKQDPSLIRGAIDEILRYDSPVQLNTRVPKKDITLHGKTIPAGDLIYFSLGSANRDPSQFPEPDRFDITRKDNRHLAFSGGIHYCLGAALALIEGQIAISTLVREFPDMALVPGTIDWQKEIIFRGPQTLPVLLNP
ncbi:cytochrome P450 [Stigmatella sp. ncwal1]|uniref:Cytochrome P450 n=1 Tax=Stigmatella ashevillensis TaxID=2995309 RepID=A0ABT5DG50_9BACT|nr:cytochrome P450 [Stigmatella ashevillena]MDC0712646.1 cytochrome P450 [Stigmatella ashevillena]